MFRSSFLSIYYFLIEFISCLELIFDKELLESCVQKPQEYFRLVLFPREIGKPIGGIPPRVVPGILTEILTERIGFLNIDRGVILVLKRFGSAFLFHGNVGQKSSPLFSNPLKNSKRSLISSRLVWAIIDSADDRLSMVIYGILLVNRVLIFALPVPVLTVDRIPITGMTGYA